MTQNTDRVFRDWMAEQTALVVDPSAASRALAAKILVSLGLKSNRLTLVGTRSQAFSAFEQGSPTLLLSELKLEGEFSFDLSERLRSGSPNDIPTLFVVLTQDSSESSIARAAEEDVDAYLLKPFVAQDLMNALAQAAIRRIQPSDYIKTIRAGKELLAQEQWLEAEKAFDQALALSARPSLALYYLGLTQNLKHLLDPAEQNYRKGLTYDQTHYRCLMGLFDLLRSREQWVRALEIITLVSQHFPLSTTRMAQVLELQVKLHQFEELFTWSQTIQFPIPDRDLARYTSASLLTAIRALKPQNAAPHFDLVIRATELWSHGLTEALVCALDLGQPLLAEKALKKLQQNHPSAQEVPLAVWLLAEAQGSDTESKSLLEQGQKLFEKGFTEPRLFRALILRAKKMGLIDLAHQWVARGSRVWPTLAESLEGLLS